MNYPRFSFAIAIIIWSLTILFVTKFVAEKSEIIPISLEIEANDLQGNFHPENKSAHAKSSKKELQQHDLVNDNKNSAVDNLTPIFQPLPAIPDDLRAEAFSSYAIARFYIAPDGAVEKVELIKPCNNPKLNQLLLKSLKKWKFNKGDEARSKDIKVSFDVK